ncbi:TatD DNase family protein [Monoraphidium neglectum]|uniref:TatD DNase family protein n=1 Tax=Monoraphidium neglectum TaxID=145388 RepID=A0A0D2N0G9_9CHLO|nr:TatD DNase family protein [Monoraphidium neglectum]KIZ06047.1 TatD DNase family protein [Monoraphidium neglectum]|eukprot:XP_013905066.1 TatD DNase family protein [Monoraphidium neglectum]
MGVAANVDWSIMEKLAGMAGGYEAGGPQSPPEEDGGGSGKQAEKGCGCPSSMVPATSSAAARHNGVSKEEDPYDRSTGSSSSSTGSSNSISGGSNSSSAATCSDSGGPLAIVPHASWHARLRGLLSAYPHALVGEIGIDRAAVIPGSRARVRFDHQLALLREQLALAAELSRPVSIHCVRGYGHLLQLFAALPASGAGCPPAVMLHSYGGSPEDVARFCRLPGIGRRFFFSFSAAINARAPDKLVARVRAVPDDRLLVESDQVSALLVEGGMADICYIVAGAKGWGLEEAARRTLENFNAFYGTTV